MSREILGKFSFSPYFTERFAVLSGDHNPLHLDPVLARRYTFGGTVVHGMAVLFQSLEFFLNQRENPARLQEIGVRFINPVRHDSEIVFRDRTTDSDVILEAFMNGIKVFQARLSLAQATTSQELEPRRLGQPDSCAALTIREAENLKSRISLLWDPLLCRELFPKLYETLPPQQLASLLGITRIVGMHCPGLNSIFIGCHAVFPPTDASFEPHLEYEVRRVDERFSLANLTVRNAITQAELDAIFRPRPVTQESYENVTKVVEGNEFSKQTALIIGGSRGLGEIVAKIICAGGGRCHVTYASGRVDAERLAREITANGGHCTPLRFDILDGEFPIGDYVAENGISHLYYCATPRIEKSKSSMLDDRLLDLFLTFYVTAFCRILGDCKESLGDEGEAFNVFMPSSVFLDKPPPGFKEYCIAKSAAEDCCRILQEKMPDWRLAAPRLPMLLTDQTSGIAGLSRVDSVSVILDELRLVQ